MFYKLLLLKNLVIFFSNCGFLSFKRKLFKSFLFFLYSESTQSIDKRFFDLKEYNKLWLFKWRKIDFEVLFVFMTRFVTDCVGAQKVGLFYMLDKQYVNPLNFFKYSEAAKLRQIFGVFWKPEFLKGGVNLFMYCEHHFFGLFTFTKARVKLARSEESFIDLNNEDQFDAKLFAADAEYRKKLVKNDSFVLSFFDNYPVRNAYFKTNKFNDFFFGGKEQRILLFNDIQFRERFFDEFYYRNKCLWNAKFLESEIQKVLDRISRKGNLARIDKLRRRRRKVLKVKRSVRRRFSLIKFRGLSVKFRKKSMLAFYKLPIRNSLDMFRNSRLFLFVLLMSRALIKKNKFFRPKFKLLRFLKNRWSFSFANSFVSSISLVASSVFYKVVRSIFLIRKKLKRGLKKVNVFKKLRLCCNRFVSKFRSGFYYIGFLKFLFFWFVIFYDNFFVLFFELKSLLWFDFISIFWVSDEPVSFFSKEFALFFNVFYKEKFYFSYIFSDVLNLSGLFYVSRIYVSFSKPFCYKLLLLKRVSYLREVGLFSLRKLSTKVVA